MRVAWRVAAASAATSSSGPTPAHAPPRRPRRQVEPRRDRLPHGPGADVDVGEARRRCGLAVGGSVADVEHAGRVDEAHPLEGDQDRTGVGLRDPDLGRGDHHLEELVEADRGEQRTDVELRHDGGVGHRPDPESACHEGGEVIRHPGSRDRGQPGHRRVRIGFVDERAADVEEHGVEVGAQHGPPVGRGQIMRGGPGGVEPTEPRTDRAAHRPSRAPTQPLTPAVACGRARAPPRRTRHRGQPLGRDRRRRRARSPRRRPPGDGSAVPTMPPASSASSARPTVGG